MLRVLACIAAVACVVHSQGAGGVPPADRSTWNVPQDPPAFKYSQAFRSDYGTCGNGADLNAPLDDTYRLVDKCMESIETLMPSDNDADVDPDHMKHLAYNARWGFGVKDRKDSEDMDTLALVSWRMSEIINLLHYTGPEPLFLAVCGGDVFRSTELAAHIAPDLPTVVTISGLST